MFRVLTPFYSAIRRLSFLHSSSKINFYTSAEWTPKLSLSLNLLSKSRRLESGTGARSLCLKDLRDQWMRRLEEQGVPEVELSFKYIVEHVLSRNGRYFKVSWPIV